jgi:hypothetical protein
MIGRTTAPILLICLTLIGAALGANVAYAVESPGDASVTYNRTHLDTGASEPVELMNMTAADSPTQQFVEPIADAMFRYSAWVADSTASAVYPVSGFVPRSVTMGILNLLTVFGFGFMGYRQYRHFRQDRGASG